MRVFEFITQAFIDFFGITQPDGTSRKRATLYICSLLSLLGLIFVVFFALMHHRSR